MFDSTNRKQVYSLYEFCHLSLKSWDHHPETIRAFIKFCRSEEQSINTMLKDRKDKDLAVGISGAFDTFKDKMEFDGVWLMYKR